MGPIFPPRHAALLLRHVCVIEIRLYTGSMHTVQLHSWLRCNFSIFGKSSFSLRLLCAPYFAIVFATDENIIRVRL